MIKKDFNNIWAGRIDHPINRTSFRYHQVVEAAVIKDLQPASPTCAIIGFESDEGVRRNKGLLGAATAPNELRKELAKLPWNFPEEMKIVDLGNVQCSGTRLEKAQHELGEKIFNTLSLEATPIILGGGHETAYGHYSGVRKYIGDDTTLGIINIDAHFDIRSFEEETSSGTMFRQILENDGQTDYLVLGIQRYGNTQELFDKADELGVTYIYEENMSVGNTDTTIENFIDQHDFVMLTLCTDVLNAAFAPGVSAPSPFGLDPAIVRSIIRTVASHKKTLSFDISEVNPLLDENNRTVKLGAYLTNEAITSFLGGRKRVVT